jgi:hypothetical protein
MPDDEKWMVDGDGREMGGWAAPGARTGRRCDCRAGQGGRCSLGDKLGTFSGSTAAGAKTLQIFTGLGGGFPLVLKNRSKD